MSKTRDEKRYELERELDAKALQQQTEEDQLENDEDELKMKKEDIESKMNVLQLRESAAKRMLELYQQQLAAAEQRCENLRAQRQQIESSSNL